VKPLIKIFQFTLWLLVSYSFAHLALAQSDAGALQQELERQLPLPSPLPVPEPSSPIPLGPKLSQPANTPSFTLRGITFDGADAAYEARLRDLVRPYLNQSVTMEDLQSLTASVTKLYRDDGAHVLVTIPPQEIKGGVIRIQITKSKLGKVSVVMPNGETRFGEKRAIDYVEYDNPPGEELNLQTLERSLIILNQTPGVIANGEIKKGQVPGETDFQVNLTQPSLTSGKVEINNYGATYTGNNQALASIYLNNPMGYGDLISLNALASQGSQFGQLGYSFPVGDSGLRLGLSSTLLNYKDIGNYGYPTNPDGQGGSAWTVSATSTYPLLRSQGANLNIGVNYDVKSYTNYVQANNETISAYNIKDFTFLISGNRYDGFLGGATTSGALSFVMGYLDNIYPSTILESAPPANFNKVTFSFNRNQQFSSNGNTSIYIAGSGQYASTNLSTAEQFYLGGPYGVRAYPVAQGAGAQGVLGTIELRQKLPQQLLGYAFFDTGIVQQFKNTFIGWQGLTNANNTYSLSGAGVGVKWAYKEALLNAMIAWRIGSNPLYNQYGQAVNSDGTNKNPQAWLSGSFYF
jgi:hemolysin activation/secretion protein